AAGSVRALGELVDADTFNAAAGLAQSLSAPFKEVRIGAALAIARVSPRASFPGQEPVVPALCEAVGSAAVTACGVIDARSETRIRVVADLNARGYYAYGAANGALGLAAVRNYPIEDMVIIRYDLRDATAAEVIRQLKGDARTQDKIIAILAEPAQM